MRDSRSSKIFVEMQFVSTGSLKIWFQIKVYKPISKRVLQYASGFTVYDRIGIVFLGVGHKTMEMDRFKKLYLVCFYLPTLYNVWFITAQNNIVTD